MKTVLIGLTLNLLMASALASPSMTQPQRPTQPAHLVLDAAPGRCDPQCFRTSYQLARAYPGDKRGLSELKASGSATFSQAELALMREHFMGPAVIVDLREESHALLNGEPVTWYAPSDWGNLGRSKEELTQLEPELLARVPARLELGPDPDYPVDNLTKVQLVVTSRQTEQEVVEQMGLGYFRLYVSDHLRPRDEEVDRFLEFVDLLPTGTWLHFHCRGGMGRTTTFLALYDMLRNAREVELAEIINRQMALPPRFDLLAEHRQSARRVFYEERAEFVRRFYDFARERRPGLSWRLWNMSR
jgi:protein-tyrosine phosphatase